MARRLVASDLIEEIRSVLDENNEVNVDDELDILPALNRGQDYASNILSRHYEAPLLTYTEVTLTGGTQEYDIPEDAFEQRIEKIEVYINRVYSPLRRIDYRDISFYDVPTASSVPYYYTVIGDKYRLLPGPTGAYPLRLWYLKDPEPLVKEQGRITVVNTADNYITVDSIGSDLTPSTDNLNSYINIIDSSTGRIKVSMQIQSISGNRINLKSSPTRTTVKGRTISGSLPSTVELDDWVCVVEGNCVPFFKKPFTNFLVQYAVAEITRKLGGDKEAEYRVLKDLEKQVEDSWAGREQTLRVKKVSKSWYDIGKRFFRMS